MDNEIQRLKEELEKARSQLYVFSELTKAMRTTLRLDEITYIILTGLTAHEGLRFNRAAIFFLNEQNKTLQGFMGIGPIDAEEASQIWKGIEEDKKDLYALINNYHQIKQSGQKSKFMELVRSLKFSLNKKEGLPTACLPAGRARQGLLAKALESKLPICIRESEFEQINKEPLAKKLDLSEFIIAALWVKGNPQGLVVVDNYITKKHITDEDVKTLKMFLEEAQGAIENSKDFENTLVRSHTDSLTSLWNYGYFLYKLDEEISSAQANKMPLSVMMIDLDDFKKFNDSAGHLKGDAALQMIGQIIQKNCRKIDILCRYGGEEFSLILPHNRKKEALLLGERIRKSIARSHFLDNGFTVSIGIASFPDDAADKKNLIERADEALYEAKHQGKNRVVLA